MVKLRIEYIREECIGAFACVAVDPDRWATASDSKADLVKAHSIEKDGKKVWILEVEAADDATKETIIQAADVCPVAVIAVYNVETGEKLV
ncbi:MAG: ferredoxin [archaeon]|nr:ferredoxin [archaeon]